MTQQQALDILKMGENVFLTGSAGSGKTYVLNQYIGYLKSKRIYAGVTASTGIAATHLGGVTIHSWSGMGVKDNFTDQEMKILLKKRYLRKHFLESETLIIDEISMLHAHQLNLVNHLAQAFRQDLRPFGGLQIILCGDFFQLPPVSQDNKTACFVAQSDIWQNMNLKVCYLHEHYRQEDDFFLNILNEIRDNNVSRQSRQLLLTRVNKLLDNKFEPTKLYTHNIDVDAINNQELSKIKGKTYSYEMKSDGRPGLVEILKKGCLAPEKLNLKIGAKVMFVKNNFDKGYVNGTTGMVVGFDDFKYPVVETLSCARIVAAPAEWTIEEDGKTKAEIRQIPLRLAWAITVHKSQGMSLDAAEVDLSKSFTYGMGYVALSRVRTLNGLILKGLNQMALEIDKNVLNFDQELRSQSDESIQYLENLSAEEKIKKQKQFVGDELERLKKTKKVSGKHKTFEHLKQKMSIQDIAEKQGLKPCTIISHIEKLLVPEIRDPRFRGDDTQSRDVDIEYLLPNKKDFEKIKSAFEKCGFELLAPVYEFLKEKYDYEVLRLVRAWLIKRDTRNKSYF